MKKLIALLLALVMIFSVASIFAGCEDDSKKSSKSQDKDDEEEDEDETTAPEDDGETTAPEGKDDPTDPVDDPTDPEPTDPEPTDPEPTEDIVSGELQDAPDELFDQDTKELVLICNITSSGEIVPVYLAIQEVSDSEVLLAIQDDSSDCMIRVCSDGTIVRYEYDETSETYIEDPNADMAQTASEIQGAMTIIGMFTDAATAFGADAQYKKLSVEEIEGYGDVAYYEVYMEDVLSYHVYIHVESGVLLCIEDAEGNDMHYVDNVAFEAPLSDFIA